MPLNTARPFDDPLTQADIPANAADVRSATWDQALNDLPGASIIHAFDLDFNRRLTQLGAKPYSRADAEHFMDANGLGGHFKFEDRQYNQYELSILATRKRGELQRQEVLSRAEGSGSSAAGRFGISLASNLLDPISIGTSFIPVVGEERYAAMIAKAGSAVGRAGIRTGVGAAEGVAGAALVEPIIAGAKHQEQADYTFADSFLNITVGGIFGGGLHAGAGAIGDALRIRPLPSRALPDEADRVVPVTTETPDLGALAGPLDVPDEYLDSARRLQAAMYRARDVDLSNPAAVSKIAGRQVLSISQYVRESGGIIDDGGELSARDVTSKSMPGLVRKKGTSGADMDAVRERLFDAGYFPSKADYNAISDTEIFDALARDLSGERTYPSDVGDLIGKLSEEKDFVDRLASQGLTRDMDLDGIASKLRELDDDARAMEPQAKADHQGFDEYEQLSAFDVVDSADIHTREAALRATVSQAVSGGAIEARPFFDRGAMVDAARRIADSDELPLADPSAVKRADETIGAGETAELESVRAHVERLQESFNALADEAELDAPERTVDTAASSKGEGGSGSPTGISAERLAELPEEIRAEFEAAQKAMTDAKELTRAAHMMAACAARSAS